MGLTLTETKALTMGDFSDLFDAYKEIYNFETKRMIYVIPERKDKPVSMLDFK